MQRLAGRVEFFGVSHQRLRQRLLRCLRNRPGRQRLFQLAEVRQQRLGSRREFRIGDLLDQRDDLGGVELAEQRRRRSRIAVAKHRQILRRNHLAADEDVAIRQPLRRALRIELIALLDGDVGNLLAGHGIQRRRLVIGRLVQRLVAQRIAARHRGIRLIAARAELTVFPLLRPAALAEHPRGVGDHQRRGGIRGDCAKPRRDRALAEEGRGFAQVGHHASPVGHGNRRALAERPERRTV